QGWKTQWWRSGTGQADQPAFVDPKGQTHAGFRRVQPQLPPNPVASLVEDTSSRGADPDFSTAGARWKREADIPDSVYFTALEAAEAPG
ncbi:MAG: hypothetical protein ABFS14_11100, partial [Gemmatimonadota bacterium]